MPPCLSLAAVALLGLACLAPTPAYAGPAPLAAQSCIGCHGPGGAGAGAVPAIAGRDAGELRALLQAFRNGERPATIMDRIARGYSEAELATAADHFAGLR
jgi:cytochrome subunit of sulfide dehydrogenase